MKVLPIFTSILFFFLSFAGHGELALKPFDAQPISLASLQGKWVFINYWASWCEPCLQEIPELNKFYEQHQSKDIALYAVNYDAVSTAIQRQLTEQYGIQYPALEQDPAQSLALGDIRGVPVTFVFNPQGTLVQTLYGGQTVSGLSKLML